VEGESGGILLCLHQECGKMMENKSYKSYITVVRNKVTLLHHFRCIVCANNVAVPVENIGKDSYLTRQIGTGVCDLSGTPDFQ
jgi:hypothetical protein